MPDEANHTKHYRGVEHRLLPGSRSKGKKLAGLAGACRFAWNKILAQTNERYKHAKESNEPPPPVSFFSLGPRFTKLRREVTWLQKYSANIVKYTLKYQADSWTAFFNDPTGERGRPDFKKKYGSPPSFTAIRGLFHLVGTSIYIQKIGWMKLRRKGGNPYPDGTPILVTVTKEGRSWRASVLYEIDAPDYTENGIAVGIDENTTNVVWTDTTGDRGMLEIPKLTKEEIKVKRYQRKLSRQQNGSNRRNVTKRKIAKWRRKHRRKDVAHQNSRILANQAEVLIREDLNLKGMTKSAKGSLKKPGKHVKAKSGLNRVMLNASHGRFNAYCEYKFRTVVEVDARYTSQTCSSCGYQDKENRKTQSKFECMSCGHTDHADSNASANVLASGIGATGLEVPSGTDALNSVGRSVAVRHSVDPSNGYVEAFA